MEGPEFLATIERELKESAAVQLDAVSKCGVDIARAARLISERFKAGSKVLICGNGGSAADCQHMSAEFVSLLSMDFPRPGLPAIALTTDSSFLTAYSNDFGFEGIFERQTQALGKEGDVLIGITTSGASKNILRAIRAAHSMGISTVLLEGDKSAPAVEDVPDVVIRVPHTSTQRIQETFLTIEHIICGLVERELFPPVGGKA